MRITLKQQRFMTAYLKSVNGAQVAREAGYKGSPQTLAQVAHENLNKPDIKQALSGPLQSESNLQERIMQEVRTLALQPVSDEPTVAHKLRALELMAKVLGMYDDAPKVQINGYFDVKSASAQELQMRLEEIRRKAPRTQE